MAIFFQLLNNYGNVVKNDSLTYTTHPDNNNLLIVRKTGNKNVQQPKDPLKNYTPGIRTVEEVFGNKKVKIKTTTTVDKDNDNTIITVVEESKYHISKKKIIIHPDGSQEIQSECKNKVKTCNMPLGFAQKYLGTSVKLSN